MFGFPLPADVNRALWGGGVPEDRTPTVLSGCYFGVLTPKTGWIHCSEQTTTCDNGFDQTLHPLSVHLCGPTFVSTPCCHVFEVRV